MLLLQDILDAAEEGFPDQPAPHIAAHTTYSKRCAKSGRERCFYKSADNKAEHTMGGTSQDKKKAIGKLLLCSPLQEPEQQVRDGGSGKGVGERVTSPVSAFALSRSRSLWRRLRKETVGKRRVWACFQSDCLQGRPFFSVICESE